MKKLVNKKLSKKKEPVVIKKRKIDKVESFNKKMDNIKSEIRDEILDFLRFRNDYVILDECYLDNFVVAKFENLLVTNKFNQHGFQPRDSVENRRECILKVIQFGEEPLRDTLTYLLIKGGCQVIRINTKFDVDKKLS